uniref:Neuronal membrane glycoprotein M6-b n=1 Tax=Romanomermis culicivorax TaxID=13658 RepID=A0A915IHB9_ROMCU
MGQENLIKSAMVSQIPVSSISHNVASNNGDCLGKIPYASLISFLLTCVGVGVFSTTCYMGFTISIQQWHKLPASQHTDFTYLDKVRLSFTILAVLMTIFSLILLLDGCLATGSTRDKVYGNRRSRRLGGRITCALLLAFAYLFQLAWLLIFGLISMVLVVYGFLRFTCASLEIGSDDDQSRCIDLSLLIGVKNGQSSQLCRQDVKDFCSSTYQASQYYALGFGACFLVVLGLIHFLICLSANYAHIKDGYKYYELEQIRSNEENEMMATYGQHCVYRR